MKKKLLATLMAVAMVASLSACGSSETATTDATEEAVVEEATDEAAVETEEAADTETDEAAEADSAAIETVTAGKLTVATSPDFAPYEFYAIGEDGTPTLAGFDMALAQYIADYLGLELEVIPMDFDGVLSELQTKSVDLGMAGLSPDEKRMDIMDFSDIYYLGGQSLVTTQKKG